MRQSLAVLLIIVLGCSQSQEPQNERPRSPSNKKYLALLNEVHAIECDHLKKAGITLPGADTYKIKSAAFQEILKDPDRKILVHYENIHMELAEIQHKMSANEQQQFQREADEIYSKGCP